MSLKSLGSIDPLYVTGQDGWNLPQTAMLVRILSDGSTERNEVLQQGATAFRQNAVTGDVFDGSDLAALQTYDRTKEEIVFTDPDAETLIVRLLDFAVTSTDSGIWHFRATLIESGSALETAGVGQVRSGLSTTLAADPALGATNLKVASVTTVAAGDFIRVGAAGVTATAGNSEVLRVLTVGTTGSGGTGLGIESDTGGGTTLDFANADEVKTVTGTQLATPARAGAVNVKVDSVSGLVITDAVRIGYLDHYETRVLTSVGTAGPSGTGIGFATPLAHDHSLDEWAIEVET